ncbi:MAG: phosphate/phosphite/phosphonate ABC transporter substrate-binding protein [Pirellulales bacterium]|nr:phosphate/phosphite/phosphonate ABC transporter substrate-binding protein [Pirellulales bacterium]MCH2220221.1 phosphate/phosphite/phosphonate ABC transporter substrate-binding protein [Dechloromonas sp.]
MSDTLMLGAVAYDPKVVTIWEGFRAWFADRGLDFDFILYSNYEAQVAGHFAGHYDVAWNSPLAWIQAERVAKQRGKTASAIAMRDTDQDLRSVIVVRANCSIETLDDLRGKTVGVGAEDSPQATLIPLNHLANAGLQPDVDFKVRPFDVLVGKHGDHIGGERDAARALMAGEVDAACMIDGNHLIFSQEGTLPAGQTRILTQTAPYDHCCFTVLDDAPKALIDQFVTLLMGMSFEDPEVRPLLELEGLKQWRDGRVPGFAQLNEACDRFAYLDSFLAEMSD